MTHYFRRVADPQRLLARERAPVTGRRVPKVRSKRSQATQASTAATAGVPVAAAVAGAVVAVLAVVGVVAAIAKSSGSDDTAGQATVTVTESAATATAASPIASPVTTDAATSTDQPGTTIGITSTTSVVGPVVRLVSAAAATAATVIPTDPAASANYAGPLPVFNFAIDCTIDGCDFSMRAFAPGTVSDEGLTTVPATAGRFVITSTRAATCTTSSGNQLSRDVSSVIDLTLSGSQLVNGVSVPLQIAGTLTTVTPDAGFVPKVGDVVDEGAEVGCAGQTLVFDVAGTLASG
jgi:hypothetical protein